MNENWQVLQKNLLEKSMALQSTKGMLWLRAHHPYSAAKSKQQSGSGKTYDKSVTLYREIDGSQYKLEVANIAN